MNTFTTDNVLNSSPKWPIIQKGPESKPLPNDQKLYIIVLKPVNEIAFIRQFKVWNKHYNIIRWH